MATNKHEKLLPYQEAIKIVHQFKFLSQNAYRKWRKDPACPYREFLPYNPSIYYFEDNFSWEEYLGEYYVKEINCPTKDWTYEEARAFARTLNLTTCEHWSQHIKHIDLPLGFPRKPERYFNRKSRQGWLGWDDFLGTKKNKLHQQAISCINQPEVVFNEKLSFYLPFDTFRENVRKQRLESRDQYENWIKTNNLVIKGFPITPEYYYGLKKQWTNWPDVLGTNDGTNILLVDKCEYNEAKKFAQSLNFKTEAEWRSFWTKNPEYRPDIPRYPDSHYKLYWESWAKFLGTQISYRLSEQLYTGSVLFVARTSKTVQNVFEISIATEGPHSMLNHIYINKTEWTLIKCYKFTDEVINNIHKNTRNFVTYLIDKFKDGEHYNYEGIIINNIYELLYEFDFYFESLDIDQIKLKTFEHTQNIQGVKNSDVESTSFKIDSNDVLNYL